MYHSGDTCVIHSFFKYFFWKNCGTLFRKGRCPFAAVGSYPVKTSEKLNSASFFMQAPDKPGGVTGYPRSADTARLSFSKKPKIFSEEVGQIRKNCGIGKWGNFYFLQQGLLKTKKLWNRVVRKYFKNFLLNVIKSPFSLPRIVKGLFHTIWKISPAGCKNAFPTASYSEGRLPHCTSRRAKKLSVRGVKTTLPLPSKWGH